MAEKQKSAFEKIILALPDDCKESYREIGEYAISLGYVPSVKGVRGDYADFTKNKIKRTILKINTNPDYRWIGMKFYALPAYTGVFKAALETRLVYWDKLGYKAACFGCGKCDGTHGYNITLPNGADGFLCGFGVIPVPSFLPKNISEIKEALKIQDEFFMKQANA